MNIHRQFSLPVNRCHRLGGRIIVADTFAQAWIELPRIVRRAKDRTNFGSAERDSSQAFHAPCAPDRPKRAKIPGMSSARLSCRRLPQIGFAWLPQRNASRKIRSGRGCLPRPAGASGPSTARVMSFIQLACAGETKPLTTQSAKADCFVMSPILQIRLLPAPSILAASGETRKRHSAYTCGTGQRVAFPG